jgi:hypothetical protein
MSLTLVRSGWLGSILSNSTAAVPGTHGEVAGPDNGLAAAVAKHCQLS